MADSLGFRSLTSTTCSEMKFAVDLLRSENVVSTPRRFGGPTYHRHPQRKGSIRMDKAADFNDAPGLLKYTTVT